MENKKIAQYALNFIGGVPEVFSYYNEDNTATIDIMNCKDESVPQLATLSTIGLSGVDIGKEFENKSLRVELIMLGAKDEEIFENILASVAFWIKQHQTCNFGMIIENIVAVNSDETALKHVLLMNPVFWRDYAPFETEKNVVAWLLVVPINDKEKNYIEQNSLDKFDKILETEQIDVTNLYRNSYI